jgi:hypothetical protein
MPDVLQSKAAVVAVWSLGEARVLSSSRHQRASGQPLVASILAPSVAAIALALLDHRLGLRPLIGSERAADLDLFGGELALVAANVAFGTRMGSISWRGIQISIPFDNMNKCAERVGPCSPARRLRSRRR